MSGYSRLKWRDYEVAYTVPKLHYDEQVVITVRAVSEADALWRMKHTNPDAYNIEIKEWK